MTWASEGGSAQSRFSLCLSLGKARLTGAIQVECDKFLDFLLDHLRFGLVEDFGRADSHTIGVSCDTKIMTRFLDLQRRSKPLRSL